MYLTGPLREHRWLMWHMSIQTCLSIEMAFAYLLFWLRRDLQSLPWGLRRITPCSTIHVVKARGDVATCNSGNYRIMSKLQRAIVLTPVPKITASSRSLGMRRLPRTTVRLTVGLILKQLLNCRFQLPEPNFNRPVVAESNPSQRKNSERNVVRSCKSSLYHWQDQYHNSSW